MDGEVKSHGQTNYEAYGDARGWTAVSGDPMPAWGDLRPEISHAWEVAAGAVIWAYDHS